MNGIDDREVELAFSEDYEILHALGQGAHGRVYKALRRGTSSPVALKVQRLLPGEAESASKEARFEREAQLCAALEHPRIVRLLDTGRRGELLFIVFEFVPGRTLTQLLAREKALLPERAARLMSEVLEALVLAHARGIVHRDIKPDNLMVVEEAGAEHVKVLDFGVGGFEATSGYATYSLTRTNEMLGTPCYAAPEQLRGEAPSARSDLYSWGLVFLECLTGERAMQGATVAQVCQKQLSPLEVPLPRALASHPLGELLRLAVNKAPKARAADATRLLRELTNTRMNDLVGSLAEDVASRPPRTQSLEANPRFVAERRHCTVLCLSVDVAPAQAQLVDPELLDTVQKDQLNACADVVARFGAYIAGTLVNRLVAVFGFPLASEADARRAGRAALELAGSLASRKEALNVRHAVSLSWRIGLHSDVALVDADGIPSGPALSVAARLESSAASMTTLVSEASYALLRKHFRLQKLEPQASAAYVFAPGAEPVDEPVPANRALFGRESELEQLLECWGRARAGCGSVVLVRGEAGIGKTRLTQELEERALRVGATTFSARCSPASANSALAPVLALLRERWELDAELADGAARVEAELAGAGIDDPLALPLLTSWLGVERGKASELRLSSERQRELLLEVLAKLLLTASDRDDARIVFLEDAHWSDPTTRELLTRMGRLVSAHPVLLVLSARPEFELADTSVVQIELKGLAQDAARSLVLATAALAQLNAESMARIVQHTDGVPLYVEELTRSWVERAHAAGTFGLDEALVPASLRDLLTSRLDRLGDAKETAQLASAIGREFDSELLAAIWTRAPQELELALSALVASGLVERQQHPIRRAYAFRHALIHQAAEDSMLTSTRQSAHRAIALHLRQRPNVEPGRLAWHYTRAGMPAEATEYRLLAGEQAAQASAYSEALDHLRAGLALIERVAPPELSEEREIALLNALGAALVATQGFATDQVVETFSRAERLVRGSRAESVQRFTSLKGLWSFHNARANYASASAISEELLAIAAKRDEPELWVSAHDCACQTSMLRGRYADCLHHAAICDRWFDAANQRALAFRYGIDPWLTCQSFACLVDVLQGRLRRARERVERGLGTVARLNAPASEAAFLGQAAAVEMFIGSCGPAPNSALALCDQRARAALELAGRYGLKFAEGYAGLIQMMAGAPSGDERSVKGLEASVELWGFLGLRAASSWHHAFVALGQHALGRFEQARAAAERALAHCESTGEAYGAAEALRASALLHADARAAYFDEARARLEFRQSLAVARLQEAHWLELRTAYTFACTLADDESRAALKLATDWFLRQEEALDTALVRACVERAEGNAGAP